MIAALTGMGLSAAAGLNAYIPFVIMGLLARFTDLVALPQAYSWIESWWAIGVGTVLLLAEVVLDKVPALDSLNDTIQTAVRPAMGGLMGVAAASAERLDESTWMREHAWVGLLLGVVVAALVHTGKAVSRPLVNAGTAGLGAPVVSTAEDGASIGITLVAVAAPVLVVLVLVLLAGVFVAAVVALRRRRRRRRAEPPWLSAG